MSISRKKYEQLKAEGICVKCHQAQALPGRVLCKACSEISAKQQKERYEHDKSKGICTFCRKAPAEPGKTKCKECLEKLTQSRNKWKNTSEVCDLDCFNCKHPECVLEHTNREMVRFWNNSRLIKLRDKGICIRCGSAPARPGLLNCEACAEKRNICSRKRYTTLKSQGMCVVCGKKPAAPGVTRCEICNEKFKAEMKIIKKSRLEEQRKNGICTVCGHRPVIPGKSECIECRDKRRKREEAKRKDLKGYRINPWGQKIPLKGYCTICGAKLPKGDYGLCKGCKKKKEETDGN